MRGLPSRFATGNFTLATLIFLTVATILYLINITYLYVFICGAITYYSMAKLHGVRARRHEFLNPPSYAEFTYNVETGLDKIHSAFENYTLQVTVSNLTAGGE